MKKNIQKLFFQVSILLSLIILITCVKIEKEMLVSTGEVTSILTNTAEASGLIIDLGDGATQYGHCYGISPNLTIAGSKTELGIPAGTGGFTSQLTNLTAGTKYYIKAYISKGTETVFGEETSFTTVSASVPTLTTTAIASVTTISASSGGNISSDGGAPVTARGVCWSITSNPIVTGNHTTDGSASGTFTSSITGLIANTTYYVKAYATNTAGTAYGAQISFTTSSSSATCSPFQVTHTAGLVAPVTKIVNYGTVLTNLTGSNKCWITQNLGADNQAVSATDVSESAAGWYWQFNRQQGYKHDGGTRTPNTTWITTINENSNWTSANDPCALLLGSGWRIPTQTEWTLADATGGWSNFNDMYASVLKLHIAGFLLDTNGVLTARSSGGGGGFWSSTQNTSTNTIGWNLIYDSGSCDMSSFNKANGSSIRCIKD